MRQLKGLGPTEVKICGVTRTEDVALCDELGVDYVGVNLSPVSPRRVSVAKAKLLVGAARRARTVLLFFGNAVDEIERITLEVRPDAIQVADRPEGLAGLRAGVPVWRTFAPTEEGLAEARAWTRGLPLFDAVTADGGGGTGKRIDLSFFQRSGLPRPFVLAGGLRPENVSEAIRAGRPDVVDVASGVEEKPGIKDAGKLRDFVAAVRATVLEVE